METYFKSGELVGYISFEGLMDARHHMCSLLPVLQERCLQKNNRGWEKVSKTSETGLIRNKCYTFLPGKYIRNVKACCSDWLPACPLSDTRHSSVYQNALLFLVPGPEPIHKRKKIAENFNLYIYRRKSWLLTLSDLTKFLQLFVSIWVQLLRDVLHPEQSSAVLSPGFLHPAHGQQGVCDGSPSKRLHFLFQTMEGGAQSQPDMTEDKRTEKLLPVA